MEKVLCIKRSDIPAKWLKDKSSIKIDEELFFSLFLNSGFAYHWLDRPLAEKDSSFKQIIPYIIIQADKGNLTAIYRRKGSESRLHDLWSIGIGGHINPVDVGFNDDVDNKYNLKDIIYSGMIRELNEEIISQPQSSFPPEFIGIINEELTEVGKVHFGVVFKIASDSYNGFIAGDELVDFQWVKTDSLLTDRYTQFNLELWSKMAIQLL